MGIRVLLAEDEDDVRLLVRVLLERHGYDLEEVASGVEVLERCRSNGIDLLILDHRMPELTGFEAARILRGEGFRVPIVLFSAYLSREIEEEAKLLDVAVLPKGEIANLVETIGRLTRPAGGS